MGLVDDFLEGRKANTQRAYHGDLEAFREYVGAATALDAIRTLMDGGYSHTMAQFAMYMEHLLRAGLARATIARYIAAVRSTLVLAERKGLITWTPPPRPPFPPAYANTARGDRGKLDLVLEALAKKTTPIAVRDHAMVLLMGRLALRRGEVSSLVLADLSFDQAELAIRRTDGHPPDVVRLDDVAIVALRRWVGIRGEWPGPLFVGARNERPGQDALSDRAMARALSRYDLPSPREMRHLAITSYLERTGGDLAGAKELGRIRRASTVGTYERNRQKSQNPG